MNEYSDKELIEQFKSNSTEAFNSLVKQYQKRLYRHIRRMLNDHDDTDDVLQNVFIKVWQGIKNFRSDSGLYTWLYRIATNECHTFINQSKKKSLVRIDGDSAMELPGKSDNDYGLSGDEIQMKLNNAIQTLPEKQRLVFNMRYYEEMKYEEMARILKTSEGALKASFHHAVKKIEKYITGN